MTCEAAAVLSPEHSPRLRRAAAAKPPSNDNASQASYSPEQQPLLCILCAQLMHAMMWRLAAKAPQGCRMLTPERHHNEGSGVAYFKLVHM